LKEIFTNLKSKLSYKQRLTLWVLFFYIVIMGIIIPVVLELYKKEREKKGKVRLSVPKERIAGLLNKRILK